MRLSSTGETRKAEKTVLIVTDAEADEKRSADTEKKSNYASAYQLRAGNTRLVRTIFQKILNEERAAVQLRVLAFTKISTALREQLSAGILVTFLSALMMSQSRWRSL